MLTTGEYFPHSASLTFPYSYANMREQQWYQDELEAQEKETTFTGGLHGVTSEVMQAAGAVGTGSMIAATSIGATTVGASLATTLGLSASMGGPIGLAIGGAIYGISKLFTRKGPQQRIDATTIANEGARLLEENDRLYWSSPRTPGDKAAALDNFNTVWGQATTAWRRLGNPGKVAEEERAEGGKYSWFKDHYWPIANDLPQVSEAEQRLLGGNIANLWGSITSPEGPSISTVVLLLGGAAVIMGLLSNGKG